MDEDIAVEENLLDNYQKIPFDKKVGEELFNKSCEFSKDELGRDIQIVYFDKYYNLSNKDNYVYKRVIVLDKKD